MNIGGLWKSLRGSNAIRVGSLAGRMGNQNLKRVGNVECPPFAKSCKGWGTRHSEKRPPNVRSRTLVHINGQPLFEGIDIVILVTERRAKIGISLVFELLHPVCAGVEEPFSIV